MRKTRDFANLGTGLIRVSALHPFCAHGECQQAMWEAAPCVRDDPEARKLSNMSLGTSMEHMHTLDLRLARGFLDWRLGWSCLTQQLPLQAH